MKRGFQLTGHKGRHQHSEWNLIDTFNIAVAGDLGKQIEIPATGLFEHELAQGAAGLDGRILKTQLVMQIGLQGIAIDRTKYRRHDKKCQKQGQP